MFRVKSSRSYFTNCFRSSRISLNVFSTYFDLSTMKDELQSALLLVHLFIS